jgi:hypothetical protein
MHKIEAIRLINEELENNMDISEGVILSILQMTEDPDIYIQNQGVAVQPEVSPFKEPFFLTSW